MNSLLLIALLFTASPPCVNYLIDGEKVLAKSIQNSLNSPNRASSESCTQIKVSVFKTQAGFHLLRHRPAKSALNYQLGTKAAVLQLLRSWGPHRLSSPLLQGFERPPPPPPPKVTAIKKPKAASTSKAPRLAIKEPAPRPLERPGPEDVSSETPDIPRKAKETVAARESASSKITLLTPRPQKSSAKSPAEAPAPSEQPPAPETKPQPEEPAVPPKPPTAAVLAEATAPVEQTTAPYRIELLSQLSVSAQTGLLADEGIYGGLTIQSPGFSYGEWGAYGQLELWQALAHRRSAQQSAYLRRGSNALLMLRYRLGSGTWQAVPSLGAGLTWSQNQRHQDCQQRDCLSQTGVQLKDDFSHQQWSLATQARLDGRYRFSAQTALQIGMAFLYWPGENAQLKRPNYASQLPNTQADSLALPGLPNYQLGLNLGLEWQL